MTVYVLTNGCYSDKHVVGIYSTLANAEMAARIFTYDASIEEHDLDPFVPHMRKDYEPFFVRLKRDSGDVLEADRHGSSYGANSRDVCEDINGDLYTHCWAANRAHAIKIASERRRAFLAGEPVPVDAVDPVGEQVTGGPRA